MKIGMMPLEEFHSLISHNQIGWKLMHADSNDIRVVLTTPFIWRSSNTVSSPSFLFTEQASLFATLLSMLVSMAVHNLTSQKKITSRFSRIEQGTILFSDSSYFEPKKRGLKTFPLGLKVRIVFCMYQA